MATLDSHFVPLTAVKYESRMKYVGENLDCWFSVYIQTPDLPSNALTTITDKLETANLIVLSPILLDYCAKVLGTFEGPLNYFQPLDVLASHSPNINSFEDVFDQNLFKFGQFWKQLEFLIANYISHTVALTPELLLSELAIPGKLAFHRWFKSLETVYNHIKDPQFTLQFRTDATNAFNDKATYGTPFTVSASFGFFESKHENTRTFSKVYKGPASLKRRLENNAKKRAQRS